MKHISEFYAKYIPDVLFREDVELFIRRGVTGYYQVYGHRSNRSDGVLPLSVMRAIKQRYPKEFATRRRQLGCSNLTDDIILLGPDGLESLWFFYLENGQLGLSRFFDVSVNTACSRMRRLGFHARHTERRDYRRSIVKTPNIFLEDSHLKYYFLGFILGDGCLQCKSWKVRKSIRVLKDADVSSCSLCLTLSSSDLPFIQEMQMFFPGSHLSGPIKNNYCLHIRDRGICEWLLRWGIVPGKSTVGVDLPAIPDEYFPTFVLGLLDSDGWVNKHTNSRVSLGWCGHASYMAPIYSQLKFIVPSIHYKSRPKDALIIMTLHRQSEILRLANLMYANAPMCLHRKRDRLRVCHDGDCRFEY